VKAQMYEKAARRCGVDRIRGNGVGQSVQQGRKAEAESHEDHHPFDASRETAAAAAADAGRGHRRGDSCQQEEKCVATETQGGDQTEQLVTGDLALLDGEEGDVEQEDQVELDGYLARASQALVKRVLVQVLVALDRVQKISVRSVVIGKLGVGIVKNFPPFRRLDVVAAGTAVRYCGLSAALA